MSSEIKNGFDILTNCRNIGKLNAFCFRRNNKCCVGCEIWSDRVVGKEKAGIVISGVKILF